MVTKYSYGGDKAPLYSQSLYHETRLPFYARGYGVLTIVAGYLLLHLLLRGYFSPILGTDDMFENVYVQELRLGYQLRQPPLYEWLLYGVQQVVGPTIWSFLILKYSLVFVCMASLYASARMVIRDPRLAAFAIFSYSLLYQVGFNLHEGVTHTAVLMACASGFMLLFLRILSGKTSLLSSIFIGIVLGLGMLSKHSFIIVPVAAFLAVLSQPYLRERFAYKSLVGICLVAFLVYAPFLYWVWLRGGGLLSTSMHVMAGQEGVFWQRVIVGEAKLLWSLLGFSLVLSVLMPIFFGRPLFRGWRKLWGSGFLSSITHNNHRHALQLFLWVYTGIAVLLIVAAIAFTGATYIKERHMQPVLLWLPLMLFGLLQWRTIQSRSLQYYTVLMVVFASFVVGVRVSGFIMPDKRMCGGSCRHMKPYDRFIRQARADFPRLANGYIFALDEYLAGNTRAQLPLAHLAMAGYRLEDIPHNRGQNIGCFAIMDLGNSPHAVSENEARQRFLQQQTAVRYKEVATTRNYHIAWPHALTPGFRTTNFAVFQLKPTAPLCPRFAN
ncbi:glycosyltransferase family 39 protein [Polycladidibacter stylochi]|uniref:glycosyltransferase family 39 protein n=1 Tax=Polycladidibacter stylochi TaxID=1807766 RepID=UPI000831CBD4|nr:glycosyltransferase family 39 protein [Pseudovibrio stylochi]